jgi:gamma-D-glutamyl-L-lysine dipeptidyl-peptidase
MSIEVAGEAAERIADWSDWPDGSHHVVVPVTTVWSSPDAPRSIDAPIVQDQPRIERWVAALGTAERLDLMGRVHTQALLGEPVIVATERDGWSEVRLPWQPSRLDRGGYPGWIRSSHLARIDATLRPVVVAERLWFAKAASRPISVGSVLRVLSEDATHQELQLPDGSVLSRRRTAVEVSLLEVAASFLGVSYLWAGLSGWGVDCSGLVHVSARAAGRLVPRDASDQFTHAEAGTLALDPKQLRWFVNAQGGVRHVGLAVSHGRMLHAPKTGFSVEVIDESEAPYADDAVSPRVRSQSPG